jgi:hypothetical protein
LSEKQGINLLTAKSAKLEEPGSQNRFSNKIIKRTVTEGSQKTIELRVFPKAAQPSLHPAPRTLHFAAKVTVIIFVL